MSKRTIKKKEENNKIEGNKLNEAKKISLINGSNQEVETVNRGKSYEELEADFLPLIKSAAKHYQGLADWDDLYQEARLAFYQGKLEFDTEGPIYFAYYIKKKIYGALRTYTRREGRISEREILSLNQPVQNLEGEIADYLDLIIDGEDRESDPDYICDRLDLEALIREASLSENEAYIIEGIYYQGLTQAELARSLGLSPALLRVWLQKALSKLASLQIEKMQV